MEKKYYTVASSTYLRPITFNSKLCIACNRCVEVCQVDAFIPNPEPDKPPIVLYPDECWYCGCCVMECPKPGAIKLNPPLMNKVNWKKKVNGEN